MNKAEILYVDAYNVIHALPELRQDVEVDLETARGRLIELLANYGAYTGREVVVVFDAHLTDGAAVQDEPYPKVRVVFTAPKETADHFIERESRRAVTEGAIVRVVTGDYTEQLLALGGGALRMSVRELREDIQRIRRDAASKHGKTIVGIRNELGGSLRDEVASQLEQMRRR